MATQKEYRLALQRVAANAGVSIREVETSYRASLKKSAYSLADLFLTNSVITLPNKKHFRAAVADGLDAGRIVVSRIRPLAIARNHRTAVVK